MSVPRIALSAILVLLCLHSWAADRYWIASTTANWTDPANWSATSGGPGGAGIPTSSDDVFYDASGTGNCVINLAEQVIISNLNILSGYTGTVSKPNGDMRINGNLTFQGSGYGFIAPPGRTDIYGQVTIADPATWDHNTGTVFLVANTPKTITCSPVWNLNNVWLGGGGNSVPTYTMTAGTVLEAESQFRMAGSRPIRVTGEVRALKNVDINNAAVVNGGNGGDWTLRMTGNANQKITSTVAIREGALS